LNTRGKGKEGKGKNNPLAKEIGHMIKKLKRRKSNNRTGDMKKLFEKIRNQINGNELVKKSRRTV
jgi:predicted helicase